MLLLLKSKGKLHIWSADGACQAATTEWFKKVRGYDERFERLGGMDNDMHKRAKLDGLSEVWIHNEVCILHQWHSITKWKTEDDLKQRELNYKMYMEDTSIIRNIINFIIKR